MKRNKERKTKANNLNFMIAHPLIKLGELFTKQWSLVQWQGQRGRFSQEVKVMVLKNRPYPHTVAQTGFLTFTIRPWTISWIKHIEMISKSQTDEKKQKGKDSLLPLLLSWNGGEG